MWEEYPTFRQICSLHEICKLLPKPPKLIQKNGALRYSKYCSRTCTVHVFKRIWVKPCFFKKLSRGIVYDQPHRMLNSPYSASEHPRPEFLPSRSKADNDTNRRQSWVNTRIPDLSFLSNNFSSESIDNSHQYGQLNATLAPSTPTINRNSYNDATETELHGLSPLNFSRDRITRNLEPTRPKSMYLPESSEGLSHGDAFMKKSNRNSFHYQSKPSYTPILPNLSTETRMARSRSNSPSRIKSSRASSRSPVRGLSTRGNSPVRDPFNFKPQDMPMMHSNSSNSNLVLKPAHRKGHRYKHSSVSMNFFQEPTPLIETEAFQEVLPSLYPIPSWRESWASADSSQTAKTFIALGHFLTSIMVFLAGNLMGESAFSTLAHLVFYDSLGSLAIAIVNILSNFDAWKKPSIAFPFGLGRLEALMGYALSTSLVMVGCDLVSHSIEESIVNLVVDGASDSTDHGAHHIHGSSKGTSNVLLYEVTVALVVLMTAFTTTFINCEGQLPEMMSGKDERSSKRQSRLGGYLTSSPSEITPAKARLLMLIKVLLKNPMRLITLCYSTFLLLFPMIPEPVKDAFKVDADEASTLIVASTLCYVGWKLVTTLGGTLLISFPYTEYDYSLLKSTVIDQIMHLETFKPSYTVHHLFITKVNYQLYIAGLKLTMKGGSSDDESRMLFEVNRVLQGAIMAFEKDCNVETTIEIDRV